MKSVSKEPSYLAEASVGKKPADMESSSDRFFCCSWVRRRVPLAYREELYHIMKMTGPLVVTGIPVPLTDIALIRFAMGD